MKTTTIYRLIGLAIFGITTVVILFLLSEHEVHRNNAFVRRYPHHPITKMFDFDLGYDSYYIAGYSNQELFLGNHTAPLHVIKLNLITKDTTHIRVQIEDKNLPFKSVKIKLFPPYFFVMDGTVPVIFRGTLRDWEAKLWIKNNIYFTKGLPIDSNELFVRSISSKTKESVLGILKVTDTANIVLNNTLLQKQIDGVFDVDGSLLVSSDYQTLGYVYYYRNEFLVIGNNLELLAKQQTIDTVKIARISLSEIDDRGEVKMTSPPLEINKSATLSGEYIFINSKRLGKYEDGEMLNQASIIDLYDWKNKTYKFSFYVYDVDKKKIKEFKVWNDYLIAIIGNSVSVYKLKSSHFELNNTKL